MSLDLETLKHELNPEQFRAVTTTDGAILIIAGAGSGKTRVITFRIAHMLDKGIPQSKILALTFTNKAAREMEERIKSLTERKLQNLTISTFHAFGVRVLRQDIAALGWRENFSIYDETDKADLIKESGRELKFTAENLDTYKISILFSNIKTGRKNWQSANDMYRPLYEAYQEGLKLYNAVDFDDLIMLPIKLFHEHPDILAKYRERYKYIMVDEFQDTSHQQYELMRLLADENVAVVGDDDQSIYSWRGADYENILQFERDFPNVTEIRLEQNYRSTETILEAANGVISHNTNRKDKKLWSAGGEGKAIEVFMPDNETAEADFIAESIQGIAMEEHLKYDDFGVLMRANSQSRAIEEAFLNSNIPYTMSGGTSFFERKEIKDIISYLRVIANERDDVNLLRIINTPRRGIGRTTIKKLTDFAKEHNCTLIEAIKFFVEKDGNVPQSASASGNVSASGNISLSEQNALSESTSPSGEASSSMSTSISRQPSLIEDDFVLTGDAPERKKRAALAVATEPLEELLAIITEQRKKFFTGKGLAKKVRELVEEINYRDFLLVEFAKNEKAVRFKLKNIETFVQSIETWENNPDNSDPNLFNYLNRITLLSRDDIDEEGDKGKVNLMTIHASKGLEFPVVFIAGAEEGIIPHARSVEENDGDVEEERRLFYVAITRARDKLFISACRKRRRLQSTVECTPSRFLEEIPANLVTYHEPPKELPPEKVASMLSSALAQFAAKKN